MSSTALDAGGGLAAPVRAAPRRRLRRLALLAAVLLAVGAAARYGYGWWTEGRFFQTTDDAYVGGDVTAIAPHVAGFVAEVLVADNQRVAAGQTLIRLDRRDLQAALDHADAVVAARTAALESLRAQRALQQTMIRQQDADLSAKTARAAFTIQDADRYRSLAQTAAGSKQDMQRSLTLDQEARSAVLSAAAGAEAARQQLEVLDAQAAEAQAALAQARSDRRTAELNLGYTEITAPIDGYIGNRAAQVGAYVTAGAYLISVIPSAGLWVEANFKEDQLAAMQPGQTVDVQADVLPGHVFRGRVASLAPGTGAVFSVIPPENATGNFTKIVQRVPVRIALDPGDDRLPMLRPGLSAAVAVDTRAPPALNAVSGARPPSILPFVVMTCGMFIALLDIQIVASSLQDIGGGLSAAQDEISWVQTAYLIAEIIMIPLSGWLTRVFSTRWLFTISAGGFTLSSMLCGLAWDIHSMIVFRALQGLLGASMIPTVFTSSFHYFQGSRRVYSAAVIGTIAAVAPTLGPVIGGWITDALGWRWLFYINLLPGLAITALIPVLVRIDEPDLKLLRGADYLGIALMAAGLGTLEYVLEEGTRWNWFDDDAIRLCAWVAGLALAGFVLRSLTFRNPVMDLRALADRNFALGCLLSFVTGVGIFTTIYLTPLFLGYVRGYSAWQTGAAVFSTGVASLLGTPVYIMLARRFDIRWLMMFGLSCFGFSMWSFSFITSDWSAAELLIPQLLRGFPQVFAVAPSVTLGLGSLPPERLKYASGLFNMMRNLGGAVGIAVSAAILNDRTNLHFLHIASRLTPANGPMDRLVAGVAERYAALPGSPQGGHLAALARLSRLAYREASTLAYADAFRTIMLAFVAAALLVPLMRKVAAPKPAAAAAAH